MTNSRAIRPRAALTLVAASALLSGVGAVATPPAQAYNDNIMIMKTNVSTKTCSVSGDRRAQKVSGGCFVEDWTDNTLFKWDKGGKAAKFELWKNNSLRAKVEFHPYNEELWVYDTSNDGDTIYVDVTTKKHGKTIHAPPRTGKKMEYDVSYLKLSEGSSVKIEIFDGYSSYGGLDKMGEMKATA